MRTRLLAVALLLLLWGSGYLLFGGLPLWAIIPAVAVWTNLCIWVGGWLAQQAQLANSDKLLRITTPIFRHPCLWGWRPGYIQVGSVEDGIITGARNTLARWSREGVPSLAEQTAVTVWGEAMRMTASLAAAADTLDDIMLSHHEAEARKP